MAIFKFKPDPDADEVRGATELLPVKHKLIEIGTRLEGDEMGGFVDGVGEGVGVVLAILAAGLGISYVRKLQEKNQRSADLRSADLRSASRQKAA